MEIRQLLEGELLGQEWEEYKDNKRKGSYIK